MYTINSLTRIIQDTTVTTVWNSNLIVHISAAGILYT